MLATAFAPFATANAPELCPLKLLPEIEAEHAHIYDTLLNGVYKARHLPESPSLYGPLTPSLTPFRPAHANRVISA